MEILTLDSILKGVLSIGNKEQNQHYPPSVFTQHVNIVTNILTNELCQNYPKTQDNIDLLSPFIKRKTIPVVSGEAELPSDYRRLLSVGAYVVNVDGSLEPSDENGKCSAEFDGDPTVMSKARKEEAKIKKTCRTNEVDILSAGEWNNRSTHSFKQPTLQRPIGCQFGGNTIKVCPFDVSTLDIRYIRNPKKYVYGYSELPDGTYQFDANKSTESEWTVNATEYIINAVASLYSVYTRDVELESGIMNIKRLIF